VRSGSKTVRPSSSSIDIMTPPRPHRRTSTVSFPARQ
jgi:hypothetical protein